MPVYELEGVVPVVDPSAYVHPTAGTLAVGNPAEVTRGLTEAELSWKANGTLTYQDLARRYRASHRLAEPLTHAEPGRPRLSVDSGTAVPLDQHRRMQ